MQRSKEEIIKDEKLAGAVQVLPNDGLFAVEVCVLILTSRFDLKIILTGKKRREEGVGVPRACTH